jgi:3-dehydroquinate synthase
LIGDATFFDWLETNMDKLLARDGDALAFAIERSCRNKADVVAADEREAGVRALLNFGHTFGHAIETGMGYGEWLHGEAVGAGMALASDLSRRLGWLTAQDVERIKTLLRRARLPVSAPPAMTPARFLELMSVDKKVVAGKLRLVLLKRIGEAVVTNDFPGAALADTLEAARAA